MLKYLFIQADHENIGLEFLSSALKLVHHQVELLFFPYPSTSLSSPQFVKTSSIAENQTIFNKINSYHPDIICFSPFTSQYQWCLAKAKAIKKKFPEIFIIFGGIHVNSVPNIVIREKCLNAIMVGEADKTIQEFSNNYLKGDISLTPSLWYRSRGRIIRNPTAPLVTNLDSLPPADKQLFYDQFPKSMRYEPTYVVLGSRGCPFACTYCANNLFQRFYIGQKRLRFRSPENIIAELQKAKTIQPYSRVEFIDDVLAVDLARLKKLITLYRRHIQVPFSCFYHPELVSEETIKLLKHGNCYWLKMGLQSANEEYRHRYLGRHESNANVLRVSKLCHKYGLKFSLDHIFNFPGETKEHLIEAVDLYNRCHPTIVNFCSLLYLPGTDIIGHGLKFGAITPKDVIKINHGTYQPNNLSLIDWFTYQQDNRNINTSAFILLFILINLLPQKFINFLLKIRFYNFPYRIPKFIIIGLKVISKFKAGQIYIYETVIRNNFSYYFSKLRPQKLPV